MSICTGFLNIYEKNDAHNVSVERALERIRIGKSKKKIDEIRASVDKVKQDSLKMWLPSVCFSGTFTKRFDENLVKHSGFICIDFDNIDVGVKGAELCDNEYIYALWLSPRGNGLKALVKIADGTKHREHFAALKEMFPGIDNSGVNVSRVCYESYDPKMFINRYALVFNKTKEYERVAVTETLTNENEVFQNLLRWLANRHDTFVSGERNTFIFKLAASCCRFGISKSSAESLILREFPTSTDFTDKECLNTIKSAYNANSAKANTASFDKEVLVETGTTYEVYIAGPVYDVNIRPRDVVFGADVKEAAIELYRHGYKNIVGIGVPELDDLFKPKRCEVSLITGHGNYGKSAFKKWYQVFRVILYGEKFATFPPEDYPIQNFYHDLTEILLGCDLTPRNTARPPIEVYQNAYDFISQHFFYIYPTNLTPTPAYIKERFLELIIKEKVDGVDIDPFNQMTNDYGKQGGRTDKYLELILAEFTRFAQLNNVFFWIIAHPTKMVLGNDKNYPAPNVYDIADGAMWNNKMDNILVYHRPFAQTEPSNPACEIHSKKIRDQKTVGKKGSLLFEYNTVTRRFEIDGRDPMRQAKHNRGLTFRNEQSKLNI